MGKTAKLSTKPSTAPPAVPAEAAAATPQAAAPGEAAVTPVAAGGGTAGATGNTPAFSAPPGGIVPVDAATTRPVGDDIGSVGAFIGSVCSTARAAAPTVGAPTGAAPTGTGDAAVTATDNAPAAAGDAAEAAAAVVNAGATTSIPAEAVTAAVPAGDAPAPKDPFKVTEMDEKKLLTFYKYIIGGVGADAAGKHVGFEPARASKLAELIMAKANAKCPMTESGRLALQIFIEEIKEREIGRDVEAMMAFLEANAVDVELAEL
ncbi:hypothetical protein DIURU_001378 [Diutina rugosa]|uniref:Uncharacterized protein n=1 Tax=Diutina rugosa TaxID=5481 RepID=A0A642UUX4_DIURU|nr:uncharacterized protein DIURU_001378 [Diutina rugosa]KAA8905716.1 hypothetical protein DIURU_001378 [Diutina rugosa]